MILERLLYVLAGQVTGILVPEQTIRSELDNLSQPTFDRYVSYLEQTFLIFRLTNFSGNESSVQEAWPQGRHRRRRRPQRRPPTRAGPADLPGGDGSPAAENLAAASLHTLALHEGTRLHHWRDGKDEIDLLLDHPTQPFGLRDRLIG